MNNLKTFFKKQLISNPQIYALRCIHYLNAVLVPIGINTGSDCHVNLYSYLCAFCALQHALLCFYTAYFYWNTNKLSGLQPFTVLGVSVPGIVLNLQMIGSNRFRARALIWLSAKYIFRDRKPENEYEKKQLLLAKYMYRRIIFCFVYVTLSYSLTLIGPIYGYIVKNKKSVPTGTIFPFIDPDSDNGFAINALMQSVVGLIGGLGIIGFEIFISIGDCTIKTMASLSVFHMKNFNKNIKHNAKANLHDEIRNIAIMLEDIKSYIDHFNYIFYWKFLLQPISVTICVSLGILCQYMNAWAPGYGHAMCYYIQLIILCYVGNNVIVMCETIQNELYSVDWYLLPPELRQHLIVLLQKWQIGMTLRIGPIGTLNFEITSTVTRRIYTLLMVLLNYF